MPTPSIASGHRDQMLTNVLLAYTNPEYIADEILPVVPNLTKETGYIPKLGNAHLRSYRSKRSLYDQSSHRMEFTVSNDDRYAIDYYDREIYVPDRLQEQLDTPFNARSISQLSVYEALKLEREIALATLLTNTAVLTNYVTLSGTSQYTDQVNSTPEVDFDTARSSVQNKTGREANMVIMSREVANALRRHPWFLEISKAVLAGGAPKSGVLSMEAFKETLKAHFEGLQYVLIGKNIKITSNEGQTEVKAAVWQNDVVWAYRAPAPSLMMPSFGYSFQLSGKNLAADVRREPMQELGDLIRVQWAYQDMILDTNAAYLIKNAI